MKHTPEAPNSNPEDPSSGRSWLLRCLTAAALPGLLTSCLIAYPATRTYFEPSRTEGRLSNWDHNSDLVTRDTIEVQYPGDIYVAVSVSQKPASSKSEVYIEVARYGGDGGLLIGSLAPDKVRFNAVVPSAVEQPRPAQWHLFFDNTPNTDHVELTFDAGALTLLERNHPIGPLHFRKVTRLGLREWPG